MVVGPDGQPALPWLVQPVQQALQTDRSHALLLHASPGVGSLEFALALAQGWLCESESRPRQACGRCESCRLVQGRMHADLLLLMPQDARQALHWPYPTDKPDNGETESDGAKGRKKPSRQIRIDEVRTAIDWIVQTSSRGRGKIFVLHPAEAINPQSANALLKTLEEPPSGVRILLTASDPESLLPTIRSRCHQLRLAQPATNQAIAWLRSRGVADADVLLSAAGGAPLEALAMAQAGIDAPSWAALPHAVLRGNALALTGWTLARAVQALQRLCHDSLCAALGAPTRYFSGHSFAGRGDVAALLDWQRELVRVARHDDHPWNEALLLESLVEQGRLAMTGATSADAAAMRVSDTLPI